MIRTYTLLLAAMLVASPVAAQTVVRPGQTINGELSSSDPKLEDDSHYDCFTLQTRQGQTLRIDQTSEAFHSYLSIGTGECGDLTLLQSNVASGGGNSASLTVEGDGARLTIRVNSLFARQTGRYSVRVSEAGSRPQTAPRPSQGNVSAGGAESPGLPTPQGRYTLLSRPGSDLLFMEHGSIRRVGDIAHVTSILAQDAEALAETQVSHMAVAHEFNCASGTFRAGSGKGYDATGRFMGEIPGGGTWGPIPPGSPSAEMFNVGCRGQAPTGEVLGRSPEAIANDFRRPDAVG
ncbi:MAG: hypothetical protein KKG14_08565 [Alphaproteobacteria bacterium]|nr:hypothetical protein [Alphaproteobacteria bacterium]MBU2418742.1 hypothetical protein [Alphaproteobacteria bacterium]